LIIHLKEAYQSEASARTSAAKFPERPTEKRPKISTKLFPGGGKQKKDQKWQKKTKT